MWWSKKKQEELLPVVHEISDYQKRLKNENMRIFDKTSIEKENLKKIIKPSKRRLENCPICKEQLKKNKHNHWLTCNKCKYTWGDNEIKLISLVMKRIEELLS